MDSRLSCEPLPCQGSASGQGSPCQARWEDNGGVPVASSSPGLSKICTMGQHLKHLPGGKHLLPQAQALWVATGRQKKNLGQSCVSDFCSEDTICWTLFRYAWRERAFLGHTPSTDGTFRKKFRKNSGKTPETLSVRFLEFPSRVRLGSPKPYDSRHLKPPEHFQNFPSDVCSFWILFFRPEA